MKKKIIACLMLAVMAMGLLGGCGSNKNQVLILSSSEEFRNEAISKMLKEKFPNYDIQLQYMSTGNNAAKLKAEGTSTDCDIVLGLEVGYLQQNSGILADLSSYDTSAYLDELLPADHTYLPWERYSGCIAIREDILKEKGLAVPTSYEDLLKPEYKGLISMPSPKASGTGYMFLLSLVNAWGEDKAFEYFDKLSENILQFTTSGSGPVNALVQGEAAIGLGMTFQTVEEMNKNAPLSIHYFQEGSPYNIGGFAIIKGKETDPAVKEVFDYIATEVVQMDKEQFAPEQIFKDQKISIANYPQNIPYADMSTQDAIATKEHLLSKWNH